MPTTATLSCSAALAMLLAGPAPASLAETPPAEANIARYCTSCATVQSVRSEGSRFVLALRYASGRSETLTFDNDPGFRAGDKVRVRDGVLTRDQ